MSPGIDLRREWHRLVTCMSLVAEMRSTHTLALRLRGAAACLLALHFEGGMPRVPDNLDRLVRASAISEELVRRHAYILDDLAEENWRKISRSVVGDGCLAAVRMPELAMGAALADLHESQAFKNSNSLSGFQYREEAHGYTVTACVPMNSASSFGSPSSRSIWITSWRLSRNSSSVAPWLCAPGKPGT